MLGGAAGGGAAGQLTVDASWLDASGTNGGVACLGGSLASARFVAPAGGAFGAGGVVDADGSVAARVTIEPVDTTASAGETGGPDVPGDGGEPVSGADTAAGKSGSGAAVRPETKSAVATTTTTTVTKTSVTKTAKPKDAAATSPSLPKAADSHRIALSAVLFLLGTAFIATAIRC